MRPIISGIAWGIPVSLLGMFMVLAVDSTLFVRIIGGCLVLFAFIFVLPTWVLVNPIWYIEMHTQFETAQAIWITTSTERKGIEYTFRFFKKEVELGFVYGGNRGVQFKGVILLNDRISPKLAKTLSILDLDSIPSPAFFLKLREEMFKTGFPIFVSALIEMKIKSMVHASLKKDLMERMYPE